MNPLVWTMLSQTPWKDKFKGLQICFSLDLPAGGCMWTYVYVCLRGAALRRAERDKPRSRTVLLWE